VAGAQNGELNVSTNKVPADQAEQAAVAGGLTADQGKAMLDKVAADIAARTAKETETRDAKALVAKRKAIDVDFRKVSTNVNGGVMAWMGLLVDVRVNDVHLSVVNPKTEKAFATWVEYVENVLESAPLLRAVSRVPITEMLRDSQLSIPKIAAILKVSANTVWQDLNPDSQGPKQTTVTETNVKRVESVKKSLEKNIAKVPAKDKVRLATELHAAMDVVSTVGQQALDALLRVRTEAVRSVPADETYPLSTGDIRKLQTSMAATVKVLEQVETARSIGQSGAVAKAHSGSEGTTSTGVNAAA
jgi:hypothetical protein